jgi:hypothetical protein
MVMVHTVGQCPERMGKLVNLAKQAKKTMNYHTNQPPQELL